jgi:hypothetical protein
LSSSQRGSTRPSGRSSVRFESVPKPGGGVRTLSLLDPADASDLTSALERVAHRIEGSIGPEVMANRVRGPNLELAPWRPARARWVDGIDRRLRAPRPPVIVLADVRDFYPSIGVASLTSALLGTGVPMRDLAPILSILGWFREDGVQGLPIGPEPSAVLANAILVAGDRALSGSGTPHMRWVDDIVAFAGDGRHAIRATDALRRALGSVGLDLHDAKTRVICDPAEARALLIPGHASPACESGVA